MVKHVAIQGDDTYHPEITEDKRLVRQTDFDRLRLEFAQSQTQRATFEATTNAKFETLRQENDARFKIWEITISNRFDRIIDELEDLKTLKASFCAMEPRMENMLDWFERMMERFTWKNFAKLMLIVIPIAISIMLAGRTMGVW